MTGIKGNNIWKPVNLETSKRVLRNSAAATFAGIHPILKYHKRIARRHSANKKPSFLKKSKSVLLTKILTIYTLNSFFEKLFYQGPTKMIK